MAPSFFLFGIPIMGIGFILSILLQISIVKYFATKYGLKFKKYMGHIRYFLTLPYLLGRYIAVMIDTRMITPFRPLPINSDIQDVVFTWILAVLSPGNYNFHIVGIIVGNLIAYAFFRRSFTSSYEERKRVDTFVYSISITTIVTGLFVLLGNTWTGRVTNSFIGMQPFLGSDTLVSSTVYPVGIFFSLVGLTTYLFHTVLQNLSKTYGSGNISAILYIIGINIVFYYVDYTRSGVIGRNNRSFGIGPYPFDIINYSSVLIICCILWHYLYIKKKRD